MVRARSLYLRGFWFESRRADQGKRKSVQYSSCTYVQELQLGKTAGEPVEQCDNMTRADQLHGVWIRDCGIARTCHNRHMALASRFFCSFCNCSSIAKHSGAAMSSSWIAPKVGAIALTVATSSAVFVVSMRIGTALIPTSCSKRTDFPSITGIPATGPILPRPRMAVPLVTIATVLAIEVYLKLKSLSFSISLHICATPGV